MTPPLEQGASASFLAGGGELGARIRAFDWASTSLGPVERWPHSLRTAVRIMLTSRQPMFVWWGDELVNLYNDAYKAIVGGKHPVALGQPAAVVWREIWDSVRPRADSAMLHNEGTYDESLQLIMERNGYPEETYYTFSYSPVPDDHGGTGGIICANSDDTRRIIGERQLGLLRELAARTADARTFAEACARAAASLATAPHDLPFALIYLIDVDTTRAVLSGTVGFDGTHPAAPEEVALDAPSPWPLAEVFASQRPRVVELGEHFAALPTGAWTVAPHAAAVVPIAASGPNGKSGVLVAGLNPFRLYDGDYAGFVELVAGQISASVGNAQAYEEERRRAEALAELDRAKTTFFSNVSHELRTPLTLMLGPLDDVLGGAAEPLSAGQSELLGLVRRNADRLLKLVNTLLDFSRIEAGRVEAVFEPTELAGYTAELASTFRSAIERVGMRLVIDCSALSEPVFVDRDMWEKIVLNLVSNAFKYTLDGEIEVSLAIEGQRAVLRVRDTGTGIAADDLGKVFERFHRVEGARGRTHEGTGIGLALVDELVKLHGGTVSVVSAPDRGSTFRVELPLGSGHLPAAHLGGARTRASTALARDLFVGEAQRWRPETAATASTSASKGPRAHVVLADDNADMRDYVGRLLAEHYDVTAVEDGEQALQAARIRLPDLVLTDVMMPKLDGFGLLDALRRDTRTASVPVIMLSARAGEEARVEGLAAYADDYLVKPFSARELLARVSGLLALAAVRREADRRKDEFLATLAHELRNPLAPIRTGLQLMRMAAGDPATVARARAVMERQVNHMVRLIDDLLDVSRISRGKIDLRREWLDIATVIGTALETSAPLLDAAGHRFTVTLPEHEVLVDVDPVRMAQVFANLLNNAANYTERGGNVALVVTIEGDVLVARVRDDGIGLAADKLTMVFEMFAQVDRSLERARGGLGIGLSIVKRLVEMHGGTVEVRSEGIGRGSEFVVRLPIASAGPTPRRRAPLAAATDRTRRRVLVVDDNADAASSLAMLLELRGDEIRVAADGEQAVAMAEQFRPEVILMDIGMPRMNGYDACRAIRGTEWGKRIRIIALTGWGQEGDRRRSAEAGFDHHLVKPIEPEALERLLSSSSQSS